MDRKAISQMLSFNEDARQFLEQLQRQMAFSSASIEAAGAFLRIAPKWDGDRAPAKIEPLPSRSGVSADPWLQRNESQE